MALALLGSGSTGPPWASSGWFGPRGLASVVFGLIAYDTLDPTDAGRVLSVVTVTVALSVLAHGLSASPLAARYGAYSATLAGREPEHRTTPATVCWSLGGHVGVAKDRDA